MSKEDPEVVEDILRELEAFYQEVSKLDSIGKREIRKLRIYRDLLVNALWGVVR
ncbi:hypothetical protein [Pyrococcus horikoshii]|nr:hypothetical protein [Pyrococcus horikoshii]